MIDIDPALACVLARCYRSPCRLKSRPGNPSIGPRFRRPGPDLHRRGSELIVRVQCQSASVCTSGVDCLDFPDGSVFVFPRFLWLECLHFTFPTFSTGENSRTHFIAMTFASVWWQHALCIHGHTRAVNLTQRRQINAALNLPRKHKSVCRESASDISTP